MFCFSLNSIILIACIAGIFGQNDKFEYECDILTRLDTLENDLKEAKDTLRATETELRDTKEMLAVLNSTVKETLRETANPGSTYVRWGRTTCPGNGTELVYSGSAGGGSLHTGGGAGVNYICLPNIPIYGNYTEDAVQTGAYVYGVQYDFIDNDIMAFFPDLLDRTDLYKHTVPCVVCRTNRSTVLMIPGRDMCTDSWTQEYKGLLVGDRDTHTSSDYICLDDQPERFDGVGNDTIGKLLYFVEGSCGNLPCPPYVNGRELSCDVCTK